MTSRHIFRVELAPILGSTFQPTGFPDIGAATFTSFEADGDNGLVEVSSLLVESTQSMANRLESTAWDRATNQPVAVVAGLPWVRVIRAGTGEVLTSSRLEAHRLASAYVYRGTLDGRPMLKEIGERLGLKADTPHNRAAMARAVAAMDPFCLVHGVFFAHKEWLGQPKFERATSAVIEAHHVRPADSGGRKADHVRHQLGDTGGTSEGYGSVPFHRREWTAKKIEASFVIDVELLRSYGLPQSATEVLETLALWEIRSLLDGGLRLRTSCDLQVINEDTRLPGLDELTERLRSLIPHCGDVFGDGEPITVEWSSKKA